ncbi:MAG: DUF1592 domain-containing protein [Myxococcales bacterium]|nr:DUF1592 domain-containing protein [Myxococcales bacterium]MCB9717699.1 DUF1592 domain-containing protein [Myxococcales bacterium]
MASTGGGSVLWVAMTCLALAGGCRDRGEAGGGTDSDTDGTASGDGPTDGDSDSDGVELCPESRAPRQLRLLTRREYDATVHDLFGLVDPESCSEDAQCPAGASCTSGACMVQAVLPTSFEIPGQAGWTTVHLAGGFNNWPGTIADGGWPLSYDAGSGTWSGTFDIPAGQHQYKLVIDDSQWIADPTNPQTADDGFGGSNSVLDVQTVSEEVPPHPLRFTDDLPLESRPGGYAFDNNAGAGLVTSVHADQLMRAAEAVASVALAEPAWMPCAPEGDGSACAEQLAREVGRRIFRRPLSDDEVSKVADLVRGEPSFDEGVSVALQSMLASPYFLYRFEVGEADGDRFRLTSYEMAAALSYGLWGTTPDDALLDAAAAGELDTVDGLEIQVRRLLDDPRARELVGTFAVQWLGVEPILTVDKNTGQFPGFDSAVREAALEETKRLVAHVTFDGSGRYEELLTADYAFIDAGLAALYGLPAPAQPFDQVALPPERAGLLGQISMLGTEAYSDQTSPVRRGLFVRRALLCQELPPPPPNAGNVPEVDPTATTRERFEQHMDDPVCRGCHTYIDPVGFGFEHFDPVGAWREQDAGQPVDASAQLNGLEELGDGQVVPFGSVPELGAILAGTQAAPDCFARHYFRFTHGRLETEADDCALQTLTEHFAEAEHDIVSLVIATLTAPEFRYRQ